jgi:hypothetical protein
MLLFVICGNCNIVLLLLQAHALVCWLMGCLAWGTGGVFGKSAAGCAGGGAHVFCELCGVSASACCSSLFYLMLH